MVTSEPKLPEILPDDNRKPRPKAKINLYFYTMPQLMVYYECRERYHQKFRNGAGNYNDFISILRVEFKKRFNCNIYGESLCDNDENDD